MKFQRVPCPGVEPVLGLAHLKRSSPVRQAHILQVCSSVVDSDMQQSPPSNSQPALLLLSSQRPFPFPPGFPQPICNIRRISYVKFYLKYQNSACCGISY